MANAADQATDWALTQAINLSRIEEGSKANAIVVLEALEDEIVGILNKNKASIGKQQKLKVIQAAASEAIQKHYAKIESNHNDDLAGVAKAQGKGQTKQVNAMVGASVFDPVLTDNQWSALGKKGLVFGASSGEWWKGQSSSLRGKFGKQMAMGYALGESVDDLTRRVRGTKANGFKDGVMNVSKREAEALVRSSVQTISNTARIESIKGMGPMAKGLEWVSVLDGATTPICMGLSGKVWSLPDFKPIGHKKKFPGPTAHWNCRSTQVAKTASWSELAGKPIKEIGGRELQVAVEEKLKAKGMSPDKIAQVKVRAKASMDGQVSSLLDYEGWLETKSPEFITKQLGPTRAALWQEGKLKLEDLTDQRNRPLTIKQLEASIESGDFPSETENTPFPLKGTPVKFSEDTLAEANEEAAKELADILANPKGQTLKAKAITQLQKSEPDLSPVAMLAKAEGIALEKQAAASKASKLSTAKKKIKAGKAPTPSEQATIDSLEGDELANWNSSLTDAKLVASTSALDDAKGLVGADGSVTDMKALVKKMTGMNEGDQAALTAYTHDKKKAFVEAEAAKVYDKKLDEWTKEGGDKAAAVAQAKKQAEGLDLPPATIFDEAETIHNSTLSSKAFSELETIQAGEATVQKGLKQKALKKALAGGGLEDLSPGEYSELLAKVETEAAEKQAAASKASKLSTAKKKILAGKKMTPGEQAVFDSLTIEEVNSFNEAINDAVNAEAKGNTATALDKAEKKELEELKKGAVSDENKAKEILTDLIANGDVDDLEFINDAFGLEIDPDIKPTKGEAQATTDALLEGLIDIDLGDTFGAEVDNVASGIAKLKKKQAVKLKKALASVTKPDITPTGPGPKEIPDIDVGGLKKIKDLNGSTKPWLAQDPTSGAQYVVKSTAKGLTQAHLKSETTADALYRAAGINVPVSGMPDKKTKVAQFLEGDTLAAWQKGKTEKEKAAMYKEIRKGFVADSLFANHDVAGASFDNIFITTEGIPVRIDNGGALAFRAQGGKKTGWDDPTGKITELESLRDPSKAPVVSKITAGITQGEIDEQVTSLFSRKEKILSLAAKELPAKDSKALARRFEWLEEEYSHLKPKESNPGTSEVLENLTLPGEIATRAKKVGINGVALDIGTSHVEDTQALAWRETDLNGKPVTVMQLKVTDEGAAAITKKMAPEFATAKADTNQTVAAGVHPEDGFSGPLIAAAKTLITHAEDKKFNASTIANLADQGGKLAVFSESDDPAKKALAAHYQPLWEKMMSAVGNSKIAPAIKVKGMVPQVEAWHFDPAKFQKDKPKQATGDRTYEKIDTFQARQNQFDKAKGVNKPGAAMTFQLSNGGYRMRTKDGVVIEYSNRRGDSADRAGLALEGTMTVRVPGDISEAKLKRAYQEIADFGIDVTPPSDEYKEYLLIRKTAALKTRTKTVAWKKIDAITDEGARAKAAKAYAKKNWDFTTPTKGTKAYRDLLDGKANSDGSGWKKWSRIDMGTNPEKELSKYTLTHRTGTNVATAVEGMLESGGEATSTMGRVQKGVAVTNGMSSATDVTTGGASYFFTRVRKKGQPGSNFKGMTFKGESLARADAISYTSDKYGRISAINTRKSTVADYDGMSGDDESIFKNALSLIDDIDEIHTGTADERKRIIAAYKKLGYTTLPDGRKVSDIVK